MDWMDREVFIEGVVCGSLLLWILRFVISTLSCFLLLTTPMYP